MDQRSDEWFAARLGHVTASMVHAVMAKDGLAVKTNYLYQLVLERMTGRREETFSSAAMQWGTETEPEARMAYELIADCDVEEVGMIHHPTIEWFGASPDGLVGDNGLIEIKCPNSATHLRTVMTGHIDRKYILQMQTQMACTGREWCDFVSYDPRCPSNLQIWRKRIPANKRMITDIEEKTSAFLDEVEDTVMKLTAIGERDG